MSRDGLRILNALILSAWCGTGLAQTQSGLVTRPVVSSARPVSDASAARVRPDDKGPVTRAVAVRLDNRRPPAAPAEPELLPKPATSLPQLDLSALEELALAHNPTLVQAALRIDAARAHWEQVGLYPNPVLGYAGDEMGAAHTAGKQGAFVSQELVTAKKLCLNRGIAASEVEQAEHAWETQRRRVLNDVQLAYYEGLAAQRAVQLNEQLVRIGAEGVKVAESLLTAKEVGRADVLQARIEADTARLQLQNANNRYTTAWRRLTAVLGTPELELAALAGRLEDDLPHWTWEDALNLLLTQSPQLAEATVGIERAQWTLSRQLAQRIPNVDVRAGIQHDNVTRERLTSVEVGLPLPLFDRNQGHIRKAQAQLAAAQQEVRRVELELRERLATVYGQYANARQQAERYRSDILPNAEASLDLVRSGYQHGETNYQTLLLAQRTFFQTSLAYLESLRELRASAVALGGLLLSGALQGNPQ